MSDWTQYSYGDQQQPGGGGGGYGGGGAGFYDSSYDFSGGQQAQQGTQDEDSEIAAVARLFSILLRHFYGLRGCNQHINFVCDMVSLA